LQSTLIGPSVVIKQLANFFRGHIFLRTPDQA
jgi:hypothetical protein